MAAPWIKWSKGLTQKREVLLLSAELGINVYEIAGRLMRFWEWLDDNVTTREVDDDGNARVTLGALPLALVNSVSGVTGFGEALASVGWLKVDGRDLIIVNFSRHNGETAKTRAQTAVRVAKHKTAKSQGNAAGNAAGNAEVTAAALPREEKSREEIKESEREAAPVDVMESTEQPNPQLLTPVEVARQHAAAFVAGWEMPTNAQESRHREALAMWQAVRKVKHGKYLDQIQWYSICNTRSSWDADRWHEALSTSAADGTLNIALHQDDKRAKSERNGNARYHKARLAHPSDNEIPF